MSSAVAWLALVAAGALDVLWAISMKYAVGDSKLPTCASNRQICS